MFKEILKEAKKDATLTTVAKILNQNGIKAKVRYGDVETNMMPSSGDPKVDAQSIIDALDSMKWKLKEEGNDYATYLSGDDQYKLEIVIYRNKYSAAISKNK